MRHQKEEAADGNASRPSPLQGVKILDFTRVVAGPFATELLALMGADVIKIEHPDGGDEARGFCGNSELKALGMGSTFLSLNAGKRSVAIDLKNPESRGLIRDMIRQMDVVVENFRPGVMARLGLAYDDLKSLKRDLIYCSISGYGQTGPEASSAGYDGAIQAACGLMSITGFPDGSPTRVGIPVADIITGYGAAFAVSSALFQRAATGEGRYIDVAMFDSILCAMRSQVAWWNIGHTMPERLGNLAWTRIPASDVFAVRDRHLMITVNTEPQFRKLCDALGIADILGDPRFVDWPSRIENRHSLREAVEKALSGDTAENWERRLKAAGLAAAVIKAIPQALEHPQIAHRELLMTLHGTKKLDRPIDIVNLPFALRGSRLGTDRPPPALGEHTDEVLAQFGYEQKSERAASQPPGPHVQKGATP